MPNKQIRNENTPISVPYPVKPHRAGHKMTNFFYCLIKTLIQKYNDTFCGEKRLSFKVRIFNMMVFFCFAFCSICD